MCYTIQNILKHILICCMSRLVVFSVNWVNEFCLVGWGACCLKIIVDFYGGNIISLVYLGLVWNNETGSIGEQDKNRASQSWQI